VHAVLRVDLQARVVALFVAQDFIDAGRAVTLLGRVVRARLTPTGTSRPSACRWQGWSSSWLVFDRKTEDRRSKVSTPSGFGYSIGGHSAAGFSFRDRAPCGAGSTAPCRLNTTWSMPNSSEPSFIPLLIHGLKLRAR
jgi:hypothetical protein